MLRDALQGALADLIKGRVIEKMIEEVVGKFTLNEKDSLAIQTLAEQTTALHTEIRDLLKPLASGAGPEGMLSALVQTGSFLDRLNEDADGKRDVARFVARRYFVERASWPRISYFVQGSTIAYYLGEELARTHNLSPNTMIHTNSIAMLATMLQRRDNGRHSIWPFWNHEVDQACGSWLIPRQDQQALNALQGFFRPNGQTGEPHCTTAFLMPRYITLNPADGDSGFKYEMPLNALFADQLQGATEVVILATTDRVHLDESQIAGRRSVPALHDIWNAPNRRVTLVIAGSEADVPHTVQVFRHRGFRVIWGSLAQWQEFDPAE
jgi:hypothetical protein